MTINVALAGAGAFGLKHLDAMKAIDGVQVVSLILVFVQGCLPTARP